MKKIAIMMESKDGTSIIKDLNNNLITFNNCFEAKKWIKKRQIKNYILVRVTI